MLHGTEEEFARTHIHLVVDNTKIAQKKIDLEKLAEKIVEDIITVAVTKGDTEVDWRNVEAINKRIRDAVTRQQLDEEQFISHVKNLISASRPTFEMSMAAQGHIARLQQQLHYLDEARRLLHDDDPSKIEHLKTIVVKILQCIIEEERDLNLEGRKGPRYLRDLLYKESPLRRAA